ncbi:MULTISPECIES: diol dehydratase small subunit [Romboutsia]|uniref:diol dehydratase small subunit n=1 Tax=Romboutsia TaxID=1501226 RepID=UPI00189B4320|nr:MULTISPECIES: diol dehydratase small subunit [Romboutsia]MCH1959940.1 diol dehydratase small subunit [Romboutsia hominis]MCH1969635.1 diol dehydratase small subunit [Romboutsia hominis]MDB8792659.1 diol dehydratase small subunit [Romboutsia sp. 1001216sp1]MDB8796174.1 diol dehydratase small subunit [Romboutsia sp. 1001216sp1]MDB8798167.1 diol dehydratase small subunit [Romboutsia sp. 1001216sp1]
MQKNRITPKDYPLATKIPNLIKTPTGKKLEDITLESVMSQDIKPEDIRISKETLEMQAQIAEGMNRNAIARNFRRAGELISVPDERILEIYNALRPFRSTKEELLEIADELENIYDAKVNADFIREAAEVYEVRKKLRIE